MLLLAAVVMEVTRFRIEGCGPWSTRIEHMACGTHPRFCPHHKICVSRPTSASPATSPQSAAPATMRELPIRTHCVAMVFGETDALLKAQANQTYLNRLQQLIFDWTLNISNLHVLCTGTGGGILSQPTVQCHLVQL